MMRRNFIEMIAERLTRVLFETRASALLLSTMLLCLGACAQKGFPPGGPPDTTPPHVLSVSPDSGRSGVELSSPISITFDDKMDRRSVESAFYITPPTDMESLNWEGKILTVTPAKGFVEDRTYTVLMRMGIKDRRGNRTPRPVVAHFSTGDSIAPGVVSGKVETGRARAQGVMVWAYDSEQCPPVLEQSSPEGVGQADAAGEFKIGGLDTSRSYCIYGHLDKDLDGELDDEDLFIGADSLVTFVMDSSTVSGLMIFVVPDDEPGVIKGTVIDSAGPPQSPELEGVDPWEGTFGLENRTRSHRDGMDTLGGVAAADTSLGGVPDSLAVRAVSDSTLVGAAADSTLRTAPVDTVALRRAREDSIYRAAKIIVVGVDTADSSNFVQVETTRDGVFTLKNLRPGLYRIEAFRDLNGDKSMDAGTEPAAFRESVTVRAGRTTEVGELVLRLREPEVRD